MHSFETLGMASRPGRRHEAFIPIAVPACIKAVSCYYRLISSRGNMHRPTLFSWFCVAVLFASLATAVAQAQSKEDEAQIQAIVNGQTDAWNRGDAEAFASHYAEDGSFTNVIGQQLYGKPAFVAQHARIFSTIYKGSHNSFSIGKIKFLRPDVAVVDIDGVLSGANRLPPGMKAAEDGSLHVKLQEVMTKEKGDWWIAAFHNVGVYPLPPEAK
jgi:uncharacterized protein (TIGR02246 family)